MPDHPQVLVIDSSAEYRSLLSATLLPQGYEVFEAGDAPSAVEQLGRRDFAVIVLDLKMPHDGVSLLDYFGTAMPEVLSRTIVAMPWVNRPVWAVLSKPFVLDELAKTVAACARQ